MKKVLKTLLVLAMLCAVTFTLVGCGKEEEKNKDNEKNNNVTINNEENNNDNNDNNENTNETEFSRGEWQGSKYVNDFIGIEFDLPKGWEKYSDDEIAELMNIGLEALNADQQQLAELVEQTTVYAMVANDPMTGASVMITIEKPIMKVTPEFYLSSVKQQLEAVQSMDYEIGEQYTTNISGTQYYAVDAEVSGYPVAQTYYVKAIDDYMIGIIVTTTQEGQLDDILSHF